MWPLTKVRRWASTATSFSLDFGGYAESYFSVQTTEGDAISQLLSGYVDITVKKVGDIHTYVNMERGVKCTIPVQRIG